MFVREGAIVPIEPLVESTNETPKGPLTLRVYPGKDCKGTLYEDDGASFAYRRGDFLRMEFRCEAKGDAVTVHLGAHQGSYAAWWKQVRLEVYGAAGPPRHVMVSGGAEVNREFDREHHAVWVVVADDGKGTDVEMDWPQ